jgi:hypothetical protein
MVHLYVSEVTTQQRLSVPSVVEAPMAVMFPWTASSEETEGQRETREILSDPDALAQIREAQDEIARGNVVRGIAAVRELRPRR